MEINHLIERILQTPKSVQIPYDLERLKRVFEYIQKTLEPQYGEATQEYLNRSYLSAEILSQIYYEDDMIVACLLHELVLNKMSSLEEISKLFGAQVAGLIENVIQIIELKLLANSGAQNVEPLSKMILSISKDIRVILIRLGNVIRDLQHASDLSPAEKQALAEEVLYFYVPLADRLGIWKFKVALEDMAFACLYPKVYENIQNGLQMVLEDHSSFMKNMENEFSGLLKKNNFPYIEIQQRVKTIFSIYKKMKFKKKHLREIHDIYAIRIIVPTVADCYSLLGLIHSHWQPLTYRIKDYIAAPKVNGYQSLHTTIYATNERLLEVQICTKEMYDRARFGVASHFIYSTKKQASLPSKEQQLFSENLKNLQLELEEHEREKKPLELFTDRLFVFTPEGQVVDLPKNSNPIDFAYALHSELGDTCTGVKINGVIRPLLSKLENGDVVTILTSANSSGPKLQWLSHVVTSKAKSKIRSFLRQKDQEFHLRNGKDLFDQECKKIHKKLNKDALAKLIQEFGYEEVDDFYIALGGGDLGLMNVMKKLHPEAEIKAVSRVIRPATQKKSSEYLLQDIIIENDPKIGYALSQCCNPQKDDEIIGFVTLKDGIKIHTIHCPQLPLKDPARILSAWWRESSLQGGYALQCTIRAYDRRGIFQDILAFFSDSSYELKNTDMKKTDEGVSIFLDIIAPSYSKISLLLSLLEDIPGVIEVKKV